MTTETALKHLYIDTVGCQMNVLDSEMVFAALRKHGYTLTRDPAIADVILFNTCSVREHAEEKAYNNLFHLKQLKLANPNKIIGVMGCMAQKDQRGISSEFRWWIWWLDLVSFIVSPN